MKTFDLIYRKMSLGFLLHVFPFGGFYITVSENKKIQEKWLYLSY